jgi:type III secretory pathway component EscV
VIWVVLGFIVWTVISIVVGIVIGKSIRRADRMTERPNVQDQPWTPSSDSSWE